MQQIRREDKQQFTYRWCKGKRWHVMRAVAGTLLKDMADDSEAAFITENYWGYAKVNESTTSAYEVTHPRWQVYDVLDYWLDVDFEKTYGRSFAFLNNRQPASVFLAEGSAITVKNGTRFQQLER
ncbi:hypothetical protein A8C56_10270 [Niabella ginsenosidivorans]|uniref:Uncharacterized protein n=1 Tax=Niabella ginsenosidivorans TaxID=1176587 RepID=A0A1A9I115_9BACT|nr:DUF2071 domain-containing protein [Niabella ginsenosidivorans]ANH81316.1 hypothetical protein A8C56_10270 [Niabella ginsenosidivorans]